MLDGMTAAVVRFPKGSNVAQGVVATGLISTKLCELAHIGHVLEGSLGVRQHNGSEQISKAGDIMMLPPGHDAWTVGPEECVVVEFSRGRDDYYA